MAIFTVLADKPSEDLEKRIAEIYPKSHYKLASNQWLVASEFTLAKEVAEEIGVKDGKYGRVIVFRIAASPSGWHSKTAWEWISGNEVGE